MILSVWFDTGLAEIAASGVSSPAADKSLGRVVGLADKDDKLISEALRRAAVEQAGQPLIQTRNGPGLFPASSLGKKVAQSACAAGWLCATGQDDEWTITEAGMAHLLELSNPRQVLEDCTRAIEARQSQLEKIRVAVTKAHASLNGLHAYIERAVRPESRTLRHIIVQMLMPWDRDCPLPDLYRLVLENRRQASLGEFHDALRQLRAEEQISLHPWTGPLHAMPEPEIALLYGHDIAYYASVRKELGLGNRLGLGNGSDDEVIASRVAAIGTHVPAHDRR